jgi:UDP-glucose 4-epimerase
MTKIVVTGGCGYIGSHVARGFKRNDPLTQVYIIDRVIRPHTLKQIDQCINDDFASDNALARISLIKPDFIVHCAGTSLVGPSVVDPSEYYKNNVANTIKLLNHIANMDKKPTVIFSSSASVYGEAGNKLINESYTLNPISPYGRTKLMVEMLLKDYSNAYGINSVIFRYFNAAGAWSNEHDLGEEVGGTHIIAKALEASIKDEIFNVNGMDYNTPDGTCVRDYIHVMDLAIAHIKATEYIKTNPGCHIFNLGTGKGISNRQITDYVKSTYGFKLVNYGSRRIGDPATLIADSSLAKNLLQWIPENSDIGQIVDDAYQWYKNKLLTSKPK